jgi:hypothetical protein
MVRAQNRMFPAAALIMLLALSACSRTPKTAGNKATPQNQLAASQTTANNQSTNPTVNNATPAPNAAVPSVAGTNSSAPASASNAPQQQPQAEPIIIPAGTSVTVRLQQTLSSASAAPGERFEATIDEPVMVQDQIVIPVGATVFGHVVSARRSGRLRHPGEIALTLDSVALGQQKVPVATSEVVARGRSHKKRNWGWIGGGTGGGALIGALAGGGKGALIGGGIGAAAGTTTALLTGKKDVGFSAERRLRFRLRQDVNLAG